MAETTSEMDARTAWLDAALPHPTLDGKYCAWQSLHKHFLMVVSVTPSAGDFRIYWGHVEGVNHDHEWQDVVAHGDKVPTEVAMHYWKRLFAWWRWRP